MVVPCAQIQGTIVFAAGGNVAMQEGIGLLIRTHMRLAREMRLMIDHFKVYKFVTKSTENPGGLPWQNVYSMRSFM